MRNLQDILDSNLITIDDGGYYDLTSESEHLIKKVVFSLQRSNVSFYKVYCFGVDKIASGEILTHMPHLNGMYLPSGTTETVLWNKDRQKLQELLTSVYCNACYKNHRLWTKFVLNGSDRYFLIVKGWW